MKVLAYLQGGLGNQCFIYATARALALRCGAALGFSADYFAEDRIYRRRLALDPFLCELDVAPVSMRIFRLAKRMRYVLLRDRLSRIGNYCCDMRPFAFRPLPDDWRGTLTLDGYWQSEKYFYDARRQLLKDFAMRDGRWLDDDAMAARIHAAEKSVFLHVRSYKEVSGNEDGRLAIRMESYYRNALDGFKDKLGNGNVFVFSDDMEWVKHRFFTDWVKSFPCFQFVAVDGESSQLRDFSLMRLCRHGILSDSSFSWWSAWLGEQSRACSGEDSLYSYPKDESLNLDFWPERWMAIGK